MSTPTNPSLVPRTWNDREAREALRRYERTVRHLARRYRPRGALARVLDEDDLRAEGRVAVLEALERYESYGIKESTFVRTRIQQRMIDAIRRVDTRTRDENRLLKAHAAGETEGVDHRRARGLAARSVVSLDQPMGELASLHELMPSAEPNAEEMAEEALRINALEDAMTTLPRRQRQALSLCLNDGLRLREIGEKMGISESRVCQLQKSAVKRLNDRLSQAA